MSSIQLTKYFGSRTESTFVDPSKIEEFYKQEKVKTESTLSPGDEKARLGRIEKIRRARNKETHGSKTYVTNKAEDEDTTPSAESWTTIVFNSNRRIHVQESPEEIDKMIYGRRTYDLS